MFSALELTLVLLGAAVLGVVAFRMLQMPPMLGYLVVGIVIGPHALGWVEDSEATHELAEFGVVFLMFSIGLEFSLSKLLAMRRTVFGLGMAQVLLTIATTRPAICRPTACKRTATAASGPITPMSMNGRKATSRES